MCEYTWVEIYILQLQVMTNELFVVDHQLCKWAKTTETYLTHQHLANIKLVISPIILLSVY